MAPRTSQRDDRLELVQTDGRQPAAPASDVWNALPVFPVKNAHLVKNRVITALRRDPAHASIDMLRTRLLQVLQANGWKHVAVTSPTEGCGKTFVAANLAISMARGESRRVILMDMDMRNPELASVFGVTNPPKLKDYLAGYSLPEEYFLRIGRSLALGLNDQPESSAAEFFLEKETASILTEMEEVLAPDVVIYDLPPVLPHDDVVAFLPRVDGVLLVAGGGQSTAAEISEVQRLLGDDTPLLGVVLNKADVSA